MTTGNEQATETTANVVEEGAGAVPDGEAGQAGVADGAGADGSTTEGAADKPAVGAEAQETKPEGEQSEDEATGAPESYEDFKAPDGMELEAETTTAFKEAAKADNLSQAQAQKYVDMAAGLVEKTLKGFQSQVAERIEQWAVQTKADPVVGGQKYDENIKIALAAVDRYGDAELKQVFEEYGLGNNPALVRAFYRIGKAESESGGVHGRGQEQSAPPMNREQALTQRIAAEQARGK